MSSRQFLLEREQVIGRPRPEVFAFFADPDNLQALTPSSLGFHILTPRPIAMRAGAVIDYDLRLLGIPFRWKTLIDVFEPNERFVDVQLQGPYARWRHTHEFRDAGGHTSVHDRVEYVMPLGWLGDAARGLFVRRALEGIFDYRAAMMVRLFAEA